jgi:hypothetical protein
MGMDFDLYNSSPVACAVWDSADAHLISTYSFSPQWFDVHLNKDSATTPRYSYPQLPTIFMSQFLLQQVAPNLPMGYEPSCGLSVMDNLALGICSIIVEDDASLSHKVLPINRNHTFTGVPNTLPHIHGALLQLGDLMPPFPCLSMANII